MSRPIAKWFGLRRETKIDRFGEQMYALIYFAVMGAWGYVRLLIYFLLQLLSSHHHIIISSRIAYYGTITDMVVPYKVFLDRYGPLCSLWHYKISDQLTSQVILIGT